MTIVTRAFLHAEKKELRVLVFSYTIPGNSLVPAQLRCLRKVFPAFFARERFFAGVRANMIGQRRCARKPAPAVTTLEQSVVRMRPDMSS